MDIMKRDSAQGTVGRPSVIAERARECGFADPVEFILSELKTKTREALAAEIGCSGPAITLFLQRNGYRREWIPAQAA